MLGRGLALGTPSRRAGEALRGCGSDRCLHRCAAIAHQERRRGRPVLRRALGRRPGSVPLAQTAGGLARCRVRPCAACDGGTRAGAARAHRAWTRRRRPAARRCSSLRRPTTRRRWTSLRTPCSASVTAARARGAPTPSPCPEPAQPRGGARRAGRLRAGLSLPRGPRHVRLAQLWWRLRGERAALCATGRASATPCLAGHALRRASGSAALQEHGPLARVTGAERRRVQSGVMRRVLFLVEGGGRCAARVERQLSP